MITIIGSNIEYTSGDTFNLGVSADTEFAAGTMLRLQIVQNAGDTAIIDKSFSPNSDNEFDMILSDADKASLQIGDYVYRISIIDIDGNVQTQQSGNFKVKWGA